MSQWPEHIAIAGGGTAGWLAALILGDAARRGGHQTRLTVIESSKIGTIGVGEGTTAVFRQLLVHLGLDEDEFLRESGATFKYGIRHRDWRRKGHSYDGPIDDPNLVAGLGRPVALDQYAIASGKPVADAHLFQHLMNRDRAPYADVAGRRVPAGPFQHAYHFDQARAGAYLRAHAEDVARIDDQVVDIQRHPETGTISALQLESGETVAADFFVDCSGFRRVLIGALGATWRSYADVLPVNRAMPFWLDIDDDDEIAPCTLAWAQGAGWMWQIPTQERYGCGYVYSDAHLTADQAKAEIERVLGHPIEPRADIPINSGRLDRSWVGNCVALGLASSFLEPLEATSIHGTIVQLMLLSDLLGKKGESDTYNAVTARQVDDFRDFIRLHYVSERNDTEFWRDVKDRPLPEALAHRMARWAKRTPTPDDFDKFPHGLPHVEHQLYLPVLDGLGLLDGEAAKRELGQSPKLRANARKTYAALTAEYRRAAGKCLPHRAYLNSLSQELHA